MKDYINGWVRDIALMWHLIPVAWRHATGRFFCWRDCPTWVVRAVAQDDYSDQEDKSILDFWEQAKDEMRLRQARSR